MVTPHDIEQLYDDYVLGNYAKAPMTLVRGRGVHVWDDHGREFLDFTGGIAVNSLGHCHPFWVQQVTQQAARLVHTSNLFRNEQQARLAGVLVNLIGPGKMFFCNSGVEANEALLKLARRHGMRKAGGTEGKCYKIISGENSFHGRSFGGMSATTQEKIRAGFAPFLPGFSFGKLNDIDDFARLVDDETCAILLEPIQGEGGIHCCTAEFLQAIRRLCDEKNLLLLLDEVQCGIGRTGDFLAYEFAGIRPDAIGLAKGLGGGFPIGAMWVAEAHVGLLPAGSHGTTFGGSPLACSAALATLTVIERENLLPRVVQNGENFMGLLDQARQDMPDLIVEVRGRGLMVGVQLTIDALAVIAELREMGVLAARAGGDVVRFLPPLIAAPGDFERAVRALRASLSSLARKAEQRQ